ncbi:MAG: hypothetical protein AB1497_04855 [Bacillota bacterium]
MRRRDAYVRIRQHTWEEGVGLEDEVFRSVSPIGLKNCRQPRPLYKFGKAVNRLGMRLLSI